MKDLTSSVYSFENLIKGNFLYVDKTEYIWQLIRPANAMYFLSRPRRFGKSLTLSTLKAVFEGKKELFKGLALYDKPYDWKPHPIIHLDMANCQAKTPQALEDFILDTLVGLSEEHKVKLRGRSNSKRFEFFINDVAEKENGSVVILLDEYDKPFLNILSGPAALECRDVLKGFYSSIKKCEGKLRFAFITGVSKFCHVSLFSDLNNLTDITMNRSYAGMLGYTQEEFETYFADRIELASKQLDMSKDELLPKIKAWYDGYRFHENAPSVYNPVSLAEFFGNDFEFNNYWFSTGTPSFLLELIMKSKFNLARSLENPVGGSFFNAFEITDLDPQVLLFQTGYLTIDRAEQRTIPFTTKSIKEYYLRFPNQEVEESFNDSLLAYCTNVRKQDTQELILKLVTAVGTGDADNFMRLIQSVFAGIPYPLHVKDEHYYQTVFFVICDLLKLAVQAEVFTSSGRIDMMVAAGDWIYVIEFKLNKSADKAMEQIENKEYALKYRKEGKRIMLLGVNFDFNAGNITDWIKEEYQ
ncbi:MAG: ATP-binding protein [Lentisphaeria bacterium]|nr:ATP-binding protein [Lentisphaeria bacterium]